MPNYAITDLLPLPSSPVQIPRLGFGVYRSPPRQCVQSTQTALQAGYRHIDTAQFYANEAEVGEAIQKSGIPRGEIFATTKILSPAGSPDATYNKMLGSVEKVGGKDGYVDLFLIHSSGSGSAGRKQLWQALERLLEEGKAKSIGVSNFGVQHIEEMKEYAKVWPPHVNQIEVSQLSLYTFASTICADDKLLAPPLVPTTRDRRILQEEWHRCRILFSHCSQLQGQRPYTRRRGEEV